MDFFICSAVGGEVYKTAHKNKEELDTRIYSSFTFFSRSTVKRAYQRFRGCREAMGDFV
jgi:uroporphyrinogen-III synthase